MRNLKMSAAAICLLLSASASWAQESRFYIHTAQAGDTLLKLSNRYLINRNDWQVFQKYNKINNPRAIPIGTPIRIPVSAMRLDPAPAVVTALTGTVSSGAGNLTNGSKVKGGDKLVTGESSFVTIKLADGSTLTVQPKSTVRIETAGQLVNTGGVSDTVVRLESGRVEASVAKLNNSAARYEIRTPTSNMGVRGTAFRVGADVSGKRGQGEVVEGAIAVSASASAAAPNAARGEPLAVRAGFGTIVEAGKPPSPPVVLLAAPDISGFPAQSQRPDARFTFPVVPEAVSYRAQIARDNAFTNLVADASSATAELTFDNLPDGALFVRVRGVDASGLEGRDASRGFSVKARPLPPVLSEPADKSTISANSATLRWLASEDASTYRVQIAPDDAFMNPALDEKGVSQVTLTTPQALKSIPYFWRVASVDNKGEVGPWSPARSFVGAVDLPVLSAKRAEGAMPLEIEATTAQTHQVQIAADNRFMNIVSDRTIAGSKFDLDNLGANAYYIRVRALVGTEKVAGPWSEPRMLEVYPLGGWWLSVSSAPDAATSKK